MNIDNILPQYVRLKLIYLKLEYLKMSKNDKLKQSQKIPQSSIAELQNVRIIQKNLLYVIGLSSSICDREVCIY